MASLNISIQHAEKVRGITAFITRYVLIRNARQLLAAMCPTAQLNSERHSELRKLKSVFKTEFRRDINTAAKLR